MSLVMAAMSKRSRSRLHSASTSAVLPEPTGPPTPTRSGPCVLVISVPFVPRSADPAARRHRNLAHDLLATRRDQTVDHVHHDADVVGDDAHHIADGGAIVAGGQVEEPVLLGELVDARLRMLEDKPVTVEAAGIAGQGLRTGIDDPAIRSGPAD